MSLPGTMTISEAEAVTPPAQRSAIRRIFERINPSGASAESRSKLMAEAAGHSLRAGGESLLVGGLLGVAHAQLKTGLDIKKVPVDAVVGVVGLLGGIGLAGQKDGLGSDLRNSGTAALAVFSFRKTHDLIAAKMREKGKTPGSQAGAAIAAHGESDFGDEDPIVAAARFL